MLCVSSNAAEVYLLRNRLCVAQMLAALDWSERTQHKRFVHNTRTHNNTASNLATSRCIAYSVQL